MSSTDNTTGNPVAQDETGLPADWEVRLSQSKGLPYYFNNTNQSSQWEPPTGTDVDKLKRYMAANLSGSASSLQQQQQQLRQQQQQQFQQQQQRPQGGSPPEGKIRCAHLLVKHKDSRRASSWRSAVITRSKDEARGIIEAYLARIQAGEVSLGDLAATESDCSSASKRGDLGYFGRGDMQREFEEPAFALQPDQMTDHVVETASGLHLIQRLE